MFKSTLAIVLLATVATMVMSNMHSTENLGGVGNLTTWALPSGGNGSSDFILFFLNLTPENETDVRFTLWEVLPQSSSLADRFSVQDLQNNRTLELGVNQTTSISATPWELALWNVTGVESN